MSMCIAMYCLKSHFPRTKPPFTSEICKIALFEKFLCIVKAYTFISVSSLLIFPKLLLFLAIVGDSLIEPFWPEGTGIGQGFLRYPILYIID